ncbi:hypothetical protein KBTX_01697 [wastewater metagenome]|uniref:DUF4440 domain-containing protein n=2 Tax=unclassified sequences TaxID=12908 RepID=A0A5B8R9C7_9ZZZZ|nr:DUF4440 domain-containing protein [Arhodomonas sp. KWT]QEA05376.1 hypothetical protein KBTEX_01697 [uncultured organism]
MEELGTLERELHRCVRRQFRDRLLVLLHPEFREIGYSGREHSRDSILANLSDREPPGVHAEGFRYQRIAPDAVLVTYRAAHVSPDGRLSRHAFRSSVWLRESGCWRMIFHQGTPAGDDIGDAM